MLKRYWQLCIKKRLVIWGVDWRKAFFFIYLPTIHFYIFVPAPFSHVICIKISELEQILRLFLCYLGQICIIFSANLASNFKIFLIKVGTKCRILFIYDILDLLKWEIFSIIYIVKSLGGISHPTMSIKNIFICNICRKNDLFNKKIILTTLFLH